MRLIALACAFSLAVTLPASALGLDAKFLIKRKDNVIGHHVVNVTPTPEGAIVDTRIQMRVSFGLLTFFKYKHESREEWRGDELISLSSRTNNDGEKTWVDARRENGVLTIKGSGYEGIAPTNAIPSSYWRKALVEADALINTQTGEIIDVTVESLGQTPAPHGAPADQYRVTGTLALNIWYDGQRWVGSNFVIDGEELTYVLYSGDQHYAAAAHLN